MQLLTAQQITPPTATHTLFRGSRFGAGLVYYGFMFGVVISLALFAYSFQAPRLGDLPLSRGILALLLFTSWIFYLFSSPVYRALQGPGNWLACIGEDGVLLKYRSYYHTDLPAEDPIAVRLSWGEIERVRLRIENVRRREGGEITTNRQQYVLFDLQLQPADAQRLRSALSFEQQRRPLHFRIEELAHDLFMARKRGAASEEIAFIKNQMAEEKRRHPNRHAKWRIRHRAVTYIEPLTLEVSWDNITPALPVLRASLVRYTLFQTGPTLEVALDKSLSQESFRTTLDDLIRRDNELDAIKLVRRQLGCNLKTAKEFITAARRKTL